MEDDAHHAMDLSDKIISVVIPAYNEASHIITSLRMIEACVQVRSKRPPGTRLVSDVANPTRFGFLHGAFSRSFRRSLFC